ncbi:MAG: tRNA epoxyqueuosine(34) reductase QueG [Phycisphaerae bacterium]|jgi:epoxyqueuosine reductase
MGLAEDIKQKAFQLGFDLAGITDASPLDSGQFKLLTDWLAAGFAGRMDYMRNNLDKRTNPAELLKNAQSVICLALNYNPPKTQNETTDPPAPMGTIANFARYEDYHTFIKKQLRKLTDFISSVAGIGFSFKICVDSAPLAERTFAARAGLGFIGKNRMLINPQLGPQLLLGEIVTSLKLQPDEPVKTSCSNCSKCLTACPTGALMPDGRFDANKCISYLTIEYKDHFPPGLAPKIGARLFGCDECVLACPFHSNAPACRNKHFMFYPDRAKLNLHEILALTEESFGTKFADSPLKHLPLDCLKRNAKTCLTNIAG